MSKKAYVFPRAVQKLLLSASAIILSLMTISAIIGIYDINHAGGVTIDDKFKYYVDAILPIIILSVAFHIVYLAIKNKTASKLDNLFTAFSITLSGFMVFITSAAIFSIILPPNYTQISLTETSAVPAIILAAIYWGYAINLLRKSKSKSINLFRRINEIAILSSTSIFFIIFIMMSPIQTSIDTTTSLLMMTPVYIIFLLGCLLSNRKADIISKANISMIGIIIMTFIISLVIDLCNKVIYLLELQTTFIYPEMIAGVFALIFFFIYVIKTRQEK